MSAGACDTVEKEARNSIIARLRWSSPIFSNYKRKKYHQTKEKMWCDEESQSSNRTKSAVINVAFPKIRNSELFEIIYRLFPSKVDVDETIETNVEVVEGNLFAFLSSHGS
jgi:hypothetical protein